MYFYGLNCWHYEDETTFVLTSDKQYTEEQFYDLVTDLMVKNYDEDEGIDCADIILSKAVEDLVHLYGFKYLKYETWFNIDWEYMPDTLRNFSNKQTSKFIKIFKEKLDKLNEKTGD